MSTQTDEIAAQTRDVIRQKIDYFNERERELCAQAHAAWKAGEVASTVTVSEQQRRVHDRARVLMNGAGHLLPKLADSPDRVQTIETELAAVRLALRTLNSANLEKEAIEVATWAEDNAPKWRELARKRALALAALRHADAACEAFLSANDGARAQALPYNYSGLGWEDHLAAAVRDGVLKAGEAKGGPNA